MRRIFIIRHGNTFESNADARRIGARTDLALVESGHAQAERLGAWFAAQNLPIRRL
ncbi:histidine phosphatase family protein, partial [Sphingobium sp. HDIP04]